MLSRLKFGNFRTRLLSALLLSSILPLGVVGVFIDRQGEATLKNQLFERLSAVALLKSQQIEAWLRERRNDVQRHASIPAFQRNVIALVEKAGDPRGSAAYQELQQILDRTRISAEFSEMFLLDPKEGRVLLSTDPEQEGKFKRDRPYFREGRRGSFVQHIYYSLTQEKAVMAVSIPVPDSQGRLTAVLVGRLDLRVLDQLMAERSGLGSTGRTFLANRFNYFVSESLGRGKHGWQAVFTEGVKRALAGETGTGLYINHEKRAVMGAYRWLPDLGLALVAEVDQDEAFSPIRKFRIALIAVLILVFSVAVLYGVGLSYRITRPITRLLEAAHAIGSGDLTHRVEVTRPDELATLGSAMNLMADDLLRSRRKVEAYSQTLQARVEERTHELSVLLTVAQTVGSTLDLVEILRRVAREVGKHLGADMTGAYVPDPDRAGLRPVAGYRVPKSLIEDFRAFAIPLKGHRFVEEAWESTQSVFSSNAPSDPRIDPETLRRFPHKSILFVPVVVQGVPRAGFFAVWWERERRFTQEELRLVKGIAGQAATAVANARLYEAAQTQARELAALHEVGMTLTSTLDLSAVLEAIADSAMALIGAQLCGVYELDPDGQYLRGRTTRGVPPDEPVLSIKVGQGVVGSAALRREPVFHADITREPPPMFSEVCEGTGVTLGEVARRREYRAILAVPLVSKEALFGVIAIYWNEVHPYDEREVHLLTALARQAAIAIDNARLLQELTTRQARLEALLEVSRQLSRVQETEPVLQSIAAACGQLLDADSVGFRLVDGEDLVVTGTWGHAKEAMPTPRLKLGESFSGIVAVTGEPLLVTDPADDPRLIAPHREAYRRLGHQAYLGVPVKMGEQVAGVLSIRTKRESGFSPEDVGIARALASQAAVALENARLYRRAEERAQKLTAFSELTRLITSAPHSREVFQSVAKAATTLLEAKLTRVWIETPEDGALRIQASHGLEPGDERVLTEVSSIPPGKGLIGRLFESRLPEYIPDVQEDARWLNQRLVREADLHAFAGIPLVTGNRVVGVLSIFFGEHHQFTPEERELMGLLADQAAIAIERSRLFEELKRSYEDVQHAQERLVRSEKFRAMGEMAGGVAHDFNNLLTAILGRAQFLLAQLNGGEVPGNEARRNLAVIERAALDGAETVRRLLEFTRAEPRPGETLAVGVNELLAQTAEVSQHRWKDEAEAKGIQIQVVLEPGEVPPVAGNPTELREVLLNLVFNAIDAMPQGGTLTLSSRADGEGVYLEVRDTGIGMSEETRQRIFDPFFTTKGPQSSGLGLSASYGIIHRHRGGISVESQPGQGTTFTISLPIETAPAPRARAAVTSSGRRLRILVIDDGTDVRETLRDILVAAGHEVREAASGAEGIKMLERHPVDLVCTDLGMPGMTGWEVADLVKVRWPELKVALITGWGVSVEAEELRAHGVDLLIPKPFRLKEILQALPDLAGSLGAGGAVHRMPVSDWMGSGS